MTLINYIFIAIFFFVGVSVDGFAQKSNYSTAPFSLKSVPVKKNSNVTLDNKKIKNLRTDIEADQDPYPKFIVGVRGGLQFSTVRILDGPTPEWMMTIPALVFMEYRFHPYFAAELDLQYSIKGSDFVLSTGGITITGTIEISYLSIVPVFKYYPMEEYLYILAGGSLHYRISDSLTLSQNIPAPQSPFSASLAYGLIAGLGAQYPIKPFILTLEARFDYGLSNMWNSTQSGTMKFQDVQVLTGIGYEF